MIIVVCVGSVNEALSLGAGDHERVFRSSAPGDAGGVFALGFTMGSSDFKHDVINDSPF